MILKSTQNRRIARIKQNLEALYTVASNGCWISKRHIGKNGYGQIRIANKIVPLHVFVYETLVGVIPFGLEPDHKCRNKACCNPEHLEIVTHTVNVQRGNVAILTPEIVTGIRVGEYKGTSTEIANSLGVAERTVRDVIKRRTWRNI